MELKKGDRVEVASREAGYVGSYYAAHIVSGLSSSSNQTPQEYVVQYKTLVTEDDHSAPFREVVSADEVRPAPPYFPTAKFHVSDIVDVYANEGWWVGRITRILRDRYFVVRT